MGRRNSNKGRDIQGILLLDKPAGLTSNEALQHVKRLFNARKAGHTGSLDKMATGLLPVCFGEATKFTSFLLESDKRYLAQCKLGTQTSTGDALGEIVRELPVPQLTPARIEDALDQFKGQVEQVPPMYSALKKNGTRLYELAYQGIEVERQPRTVTIYGINLLNYKNSILELDITCSKGTYIRTLAEDIGKTLNSCAHVCALRRIGTGPFVEEQMITLQYLEQQSRHGTEVLDRELLDIDAALVNLPAVELTDIVSDYLCDGQAVVVPHAPTSGILRIYSENKSFIGIGEVLDDGRIAPRRLIIQPK